MELIFTGDLILDEPQPDYWLGGIAPALRRADLCIGHLEVPHTTHVAASGDDVPAPGADPSHLPALARAGIGVVTLAGNHIADLGEIGITDTLRGLAQAGIAHTGAGATLSDARKPAIVHRLGKRIAVLSYNCVGPESSWAGPTHAGCAYVRIETVDGSPIRPAAALERIDPASLVTLAEDIKVAKSLADFVVVAFHKGIVHTRARLAPYERALAHAAVDAGCDVVIGHHAHIVRGIEFYRGAPVFHGLGNGCVVTRALSPDQASPERAAWARKRKELFGFEPDPAYVLAPFHPEAVNALLGRVGIDATGKIRVGFIPGHVDPPGRPRIALEASQRIADYIQTIGIEAGLSPLTMQITSEGVWLK